MAHNGGPDLGDEEETDVDADYFQSDTVQLLNPHFGAQSRKSSLSAAILTLVSTTMGGTVLSLPWAMVQTGLVVGLLSLMFWAAMAYFSIYILIMCARRSGDATYEEVAKRAFGPRMKYVVVVQLIVLCWTTTIAYIVLSGTMTHNVLQAIAHWAGATLPSWLTTKLTMVLVALYVMPRCFARQLSSLRWTSMFSVCSVLCLVAVVVIRTIQRLARNDGHDLHVAVWPKTMQGIPYSLPLFSAAFVCHFNVLPTHVELTQPTRARMNTVLRTTIQCCMWIYIAVATMGYLYDTERICDNIMSNFCETDPVATVGRIALVLTITFNLPLIVIPCRANLERLFEGQNLPVEEEVPDLQPFATEDADDAVMCTGGPALRRALLTVAVLASACVTACFIPGVSVIWTLTGSTVSLSVAFIMPCAFYLKLRAARPWNVRKALAVLLLAVAAVSMGVCTFEAVKHVVAGHSSSCPAGFNPCA